ncbi:MAG: hypothetical protein Q7T81_06880 [Pseudolabrys sp.]|nr:hypothetical protein [Pseudolabrys sp.]
MKRWSALVLAAALLYVAPAFAQKAKDAVAPPAVQKEFDSFIAKFRTALKANDVAAVISMTQLPFMKDANVSDAAQFRDRVYKPEFTAKSRACLQRSKAVYDRDGANNENFFMFCGEQMFTFTRTPTGFLFTEIGVKD